VVLSEFLACRFGNGERAEGVGGEEARVPQQGLAGLQVVDLGAGTGMAGAVCARLGARVCITDKDFVLPLIWANATINGAEAVARGEVWGEAVCWGQRLPKRLKRLDVDLIVASDVVGCGDEALYPGLLKTLLDLSAPHTLTLMTYKPRAAFERLFFAMAKRNFNVRRIARGLLPPASALEMFSSVVQVLVLIPLSAPALQREPRPAPAAAADAAGYSEATSGSGQTELCAAAAASPSVSSTPTATAAPAAAAGLRGRLSLHQRGPEERPAEAAASAALKRPRHQGHDLAGGAGGAGLQGGRISEASPLAHAQCLHTLLSEGEEFDWEAAQFSFAHLED